MKLFQSTLPRGERPPLCPSSLIIYPSFNPRSRVGSDKTKPLINRGFERFQSTLPRGERPPDCEPTWIRIKCFNPRSRVGSDQRWTRWESAKKSFNPRSRVGSDPSLNCIDKIIKVSIHAPAWGATTPRYHCRACIHSFNPRSRVGSDLMRLA